MIKGRGRWHDGREMVLLGLSHENVARLFADEPIVVPSGDPAPAGVSLPAGPVIVLVAGSDEESILAKFAAAGLLSGDATAVHRYGPQREG